MSPKSPDPAARPYQPSDEQMRLLPDVSGNAINGLGETAVRRPSPIYWHHHAKIAHGPVMKWMLERTSREQPSVDRLHEKFGGRGPAEPAPLAQSRIENTPKDWTAQVKAFAVTNEADLVGIARIDPNWVFEGYELSHKWIIVLGITMDQLRLAAVWPEAASVEEVMAGYNRGDRAAKALADHIRGQGWEAEGHGGPIAGPLTMIPAALACGFGELGKHGSIINRTYGSSFRLAAVTTSLPLVADAPDIFGADDFCASCQVCARACPPQAIAHDKQTVRGTRKWYVDFDKCVPYFNETYGCGICIAVCPWSRPGTAPRLAEKMSRRKNEKA
ncbi:MAG TPA: 4Fe-4S dicluster domain-containing protein [Alphaproteobacteria bacterium]|nr:4Fe-4S dicluster domain-containing protein [Alphaproteobacteria bacterium]